MKLTYYPEWGMLYLQLRDVVSTESEEVTPGIVVDFDADGRVVGVEFEHADKFDVAALEVAGFPAGAVAIHQAQEGA